MVEGAEVRLPAVKAVHSDNSETNAAKTGEGLVSKELVKAQQKDAVSVKDSVPEPISKAGPAKTTAKDTQFAPIEQHKQAKADDKVAIQLNVWIFVEGAYIQSDVAPRSSAPEKSPSLGKRMPPPVVCKIFVIISARHHGFRSGVQKAGRVPCP